MGCALFVGGWWHSDLSYFGMDFKCEMRFGLRLTS